MQYLIECEDSSMCIIYKKSIKTSEKLSEIKIGKVVQFFWPENSLKAQEYAGKIIAADYDEAILLNLMHSMIKERVKKKKTNKKFVEKKNKLIKADNLTQQHILEKVIAETNCDKPLQELDSIIETIDKTKSDIVNFQDNILKKLDFMKTKLLSVSISNKQEKSRRRSYGMIIESNDDYTLTNNTEVNISEGNLNLISEPCTSKPATASTCNNTELFATSNRRSFRMVSDFDVDEVQSTNSQQSEDSYKSFIRDTDIACDLKASSPISIDHRDFLMDDWNDDECNERKRSLEMSKKLIEGNSITLTSPKRAEKIDHCFAKKMKKEEISSSSVKKAQQEKMCFSNLKTHKSVFVIDDSEETENYNSNNESDVRTSSCTSKNDIYKYCSENDKKVKELIKGSEVFIMSSELLNITNTAKKSTELARALFRAIFTEDALSNCSLTGAKPKGCTKSDTIRQGLPENAVNTILTYASQYGKNKGWEVQSRQQIKGSVRSLLQEYKSTNLKNALLKKK